MNTSIKNKTAGGKRKKSGRFNLIDFLLILIVLFIIFTVIYIFAPFSAFKTIFFAEETAIEYTVEFVGVDKEFVNTIHKNNTVVDSVSKNQIGTVQATDYSEPYKQLEAVKKDDKLVGIYAEHPDKYNVVVTISANAKYAKGDGYRVNDCRIAVGEKMNLIFPNYMGECYCIDISADS